MGNQSGNCYKSGANDELLELKSNGNTQFTHHVNAKTRKDSHKFTFPGSQTDEMLDKVVIPKHENLKMRDGREVIGMSENGVISEGKIKYVNFDQYDGQIENGEANGFGKIKYQNGDVYEGNFEKDQKYGKGFYYFSTGNKYDGTYKDDVFNGYGTFYFKNGNVYQGITFTY